MTPVLAEFWWPSRQESLRSTQTLPLSISLAVRLGETVRDVEKEGDRKREREREKEKEKRGADVTSHGFEEEKEVVAHDAASISRQNASI